MWPTNLGYNVVQGTGQPLHNDIILQLLKTNIQREKTLPPRASTGHEQNISLYLKSAQGSNNVLS